MGILLIPLLVLVPGWDGFVYSPRSSYSDLVISHYPNAVYLLDCLHHGQFPLWSPLILGGYPFAADPLAGIWYPAGWLAYLLPLPLGFNVSILIHMLCSGMGMLLFLRAFGLEDLPSLAGALAWELLPKTFAHFGAGHLSLVYAIAWTPWLLLAEQKAAERKFRLGPGIVLGLLTLADVRWAAYAGGLWLAFAFFLFLKGQTKEVQGLGGKETVDDVPTGRFGLSETEGSHSPKPHNPRLGRLRYFLGWGRYAVENVLLAGLIAAPQLVPLAEFTRLSSRAVLTAADNLALSLDPMQWFGLIAPNFQSYAEWTVYLGALPLLAILWGLTYRELRREIRFWLWVLVVTGLLALGSYFPPNQWLARLPGMDLLRVPSRFLLIFGFAGVVVLARFLQADLRSVSKGALFWPNLVSFGSVAFLWVIVAGLWAVTGSLSVPYAWGAASITVGVTLVTLKRLGTISSKAFLAVVIGCLVLDLGCVAHSDFLYRNPGEVLTERADVAASLQSQAGLFRIYSPSYSIPQQTAAAFGLETVQGVDPLQLKTTLAFLQGATGIPMQGYSVTVPPFATTNLTSANQGYEPDAEQLGLLNVRFIIADFPIQAGGLEEWKMVGNVHIYQNAAWRPRVWVQAADEGNKSWRSVGILERTPNRLILQAEGPGDLVLSEVDYPGWQVRVDGIPAQIHSAYGLLRAVRLDAGLHTVEYIFQPVSVWVGLILGMAGWLWAAWKAWRNGESWRR